MSSFVAAVQGFLVGASLIVAIGAQNAFVLRQGLLRRHVGPIVALCALADAGLIGLGVAGVGGIVQASPDALRLVGYGGAAFLAWYGGLAARNALSPRELAASAEAQGGLGPALAKVAAFTFLNPHVYLDTVVLVGALSGRFGGMGRWAFGLGAAAASLTWFSALGYGARLVAPLFARQIAWRILDSVIAIVMWAIALSLLRSLP